MKRERREKRPMASKKGKGTAAGGFRYVRLPISAIKEYKAQKASKKSKGK